MQKHIQYILQTLSGKLNFNFKRDFAHAQQYCVCTHNPLQLSPNKRIQLQTTSQRTSPRIENLKWVIRCSNSKKLHLPLIEFHKYHTHACHMELSRHHLKLLYNDQLKVCAICDSTKKMTNYCSYLPNSQHKQELENWYIKKIAPSKWAWPIKK